MKICFFLLFFLYLILLSLQEIKRNKLIIPISLFCLLIYGLSYFYAITPSSSKDFSILIFLALGILFAIFLRFFDFRLSFLLCLFIMGSRMMGFSFSPNQEILGFFVVNTLNTIPILWGLFLVYHQKPYQKFFFLFLCFSLIACLDTFLVIQSNTLHTILENTILLVCTLWALFLSHKNQNFFLLCYFVLLSILLFNNFLPIILFAYFPIGIVFIPFTYLITYSGEILLFLILCYEIFLKNPKGSHAEGPQDQGSQAPSKESNTPSHSSQFHPPRES